MLNLQRTRGEIRVIDALAYYFALAEGVWKTILGIARFKSRGYAMIGTLTIFSYAHAFGVEHSYRWWGFQFPDTPLR